MKINYTLTYFGYTGGIRTFYEISKRLIEKNHQVSLTVLYSPKKSGYPWKAKIIRTPFVKTALNKIIFQKILNNLPYYIFNNTEMLRKKMPDCDINVATTFSSVLPVYYSQKGLPFHHIQHDETLFVKDRYRKRLAEASYFLPLKARIVNSSWLQKRLKKKYNVESYLVPHAIANEIFYPRKVTKKIHTKRVVSFGKKTEWKGFKDALEAMKTVMRKRKDVEWFVYGQNPNLPQSPEAPYTFIHFPSDDELARLYSSADVVICPSWYESFPAPPLEAMSCGTPIVTTKYGTEDYASNEKNSLVVPPRNPKAMANAILRVLEDKKLAEKLKKNGIETAKNFSWDKSTKKIEQIFLEKLKKHSFD